MDLASAFHQAPAHLRMLVVMRAVAIVAIAAVYLCFDCFLDVRVPVAAVGAILGFYAFFDFATLRRLRRPAPIGALEMLGQLLVDVAVLTAALYLTGGARNPLALYYLLLVLYSSTALPPRLVWPFAGVCVVAYVALFHFHIALPGGAGGPAPRRAAGAPAPLCPGRVALAVAATGRQTPAATSWLRPVGG